MDCGGNPDIHVHVHAGPSGVVRSQYDPADLHGGEVESCTGGLRCAEMARSSTRLSCKVAASYCRVYDDLVV